MHTAKVSDFVIGEKKLTLLGGPCCAESLEICMEVASVMKKTAAELGVNYVFKASFDKANRSSIHSYRGPGLEKGLEMLAAVKKELALPVVTDIHESWQADPVGKVADIIQIPAFLSRQTDLLVAAAKTGRPVNVKKAQFMAPEDLKGVVVKLEESGCRGILLTDRGTSFGYHNLVVDFRGLQTMREMGYPVVFDATHSVQLPGGNGTTSGGQRQFIASLSYAAAAVGIDAIFMEIHPDPSKALSDGPNSLTPADAEKILRKVIKIHDIA